MVQTQRHYANYIEEYGDAWNKKWVSFFSNPNLRKTQLHRGLNDVFAVCLCSALRRRANVWLLPGLVRALAISALVACSSTIAVVKLRWRKDLRVYGALLVTVEKRREGREQGRWGGWGYPRRTSRSLRRFCAATAHLRWMRRKADRCKRRGGAQRLYPQVKRDSLVSWPRHRRHTYIPLINPFFCLSHRLSPARTRSTILSPRWRSSRLPWRPPAA